MVNKVVYFDVDHWHR